MVRTTIMLPEGLKRAAEAEARRRGVSLGEILRHSLEVELAARGGKDPFLSDSEVYGGSVPRRLSVDHDSFLYGSNS
jgi:hypothetical protein